jgi:small subunit ribosomal protein S17
MSEAINPGAQIGVVQTDARDKTRKVVIEYRTKHPKYGKFVSKRTVLHCHDENNESHNGDIVEIVQCRPVSKTKTWKINRIVEKRG